MSTPTTKPKRRKAPKHGGEIRAFRFAMVVHQSRMAPLFDACDVLLDLRNRLADHLAENRRVNRDRKQNGQDDQIHYPDRAELYKLVSAWAAEDERLSGVHSHLRQNVVTRVLEGVKRWMEAVAEGKGNVRPPRPKDKKHYRSFTFPEYGNGCRITKHRVYLSGFGWFKLHDHRKIAGKPKTVTIKFSQGRWWCTVTAQSFETDLHAPLATDDVRPDLGGDPGLENLLTTSDGQVFSPRKAYQEARAGLCRAQKAVSRKFQAREKAHEALCTAAKVRGEKAPALRDVPYSNRLQDAIKRLAKRHTKVERVRDHEQKKLASRLEDTVRRLACEEHGVHFMLRNRRMAKAAADRAIHSFKHHLASAFGKRRYVATANQRAGIGGNSQTCVCGALVPKNLKDRVHTCPNCGLVAPRDFVSANIVQLIAFGTVHPDLLRRLPVESHPIHAVRGETSAPKKTAKRGGRVKAPSVGGQSIVRRGGTEAAASESPACELVETPASEVPAKRQSPARAERPRVGNLPRQARPGGIATGKPEALPSEPPLREIVPVGAGSVKTSVARRASTGRSGRKSTREAHPL